MTKQTTKPNLAIFKNEHAGKPIKKRDGSFVTNGNGEAIKHGDLNGKIMLPESLEAGQYDVSLYAKKFIDKKTGEQKTMYSGTIKKAFVRQDINKHSQDKANAYVADEELPFDF